MFCTLPPGTICSQCHLDSSLMPGMMLPSGPECQDCLLGIPRKRPTPISHLHSSPTLDDRARTYNLDNKGVIYIMCGVCGESIKLSSTTRIKVGRFGHIEREIKWSEFDPARHKLIAVSTDQPVKTCIIEQSIPHVRQVEACVDCADKYNAEVIRSKHLKSGQQPFLLLA